METTYTGFVSNFLEGEGAYFAGMSRGEEFLKFIYKLVCFSSLAFPDYKYFPAVFAKLAEISFISGGIALAFCFPELFVCFWDDTAVFAEVHVSEAAIDKYNLIKISRS
jgi:hypothetical protein